jgi:hypothetical protein
MKLTQRRSTSSSTSLSACASGFGCKIVLPTVLVAVQKQGSLLQNQGELSTQLSSMPH